jgi:hypothetical protein
MTARTILRTLITASVVSLVTVAPAFADWTLAGFLGAAHTRPSSLTLTRPPDATDLSMSPIRYGSESLEVPVYYGYRAAFFPRSGWFGIEGELIHLKVVADTTRTVRVHGMWRGARVDETVRLSSVIDDFSITHGVNLLLVNAVARRRTGIDSAGHPRWTLTARLGAGGSVPHPESTISGRHVEGYEWGAMSIQGAAGVELRLVSGLSLVGEYKLTRSVQDVTVADGTARTPLTTHHVVAGVAVGLGGQRRTHNRRASTTKRLH